MANQFFSFKQFTVHQQHCAMKVCTDACLFGAWTADLIEKNALTHQRMLDIGAGTGLLSLMLAQQCGHSLVDAIEIDVAAAQQAAENFALSPWQHRLQVVNMAIQNFEPALRYDFIITNPPFFENDLASANAQRNVALHSKLLGLNELLAAIQQHLSASGHFAVLLPFHRTTAFETMALKAGFYLQQKTVVQQTPAHPPFRSMLLFGTSPQPCNETTLVIKDVAGNYTGDFIRLLQPFYLYL